MAKNCPKCNFLNPYGAQICGECGHPIMTPKIMDQGKRLKQPSVPSGISLQSIGLEKAERGVTLSINTLSALCLFIYGLIIITLSILKWFEPVYGMQFILLPANLYPLILGILFGSFTIALAFGYFKQRPWVVLWYFVWVGLQAVLLLIFMIGWWNPDWFTIKVRIIFLVLIVIECIFIPFLLRLKRRPVKG
ncbi:MAG: hypothetical protein ACMUIM_10450 [bacterium]